MKTAPISPNSHPIISNTVPKGATTDIIAPDPLIEGMVKLAANKKKAPDTANQLNPFSALCLIFAHSARTGASRKATPKPTNPSNTICSP